MWVQFKIDFRRAHQELVESTQMSQTASFQGNNVEVQQGKIYAIANMENATIADRESMVTLTQIVSHLTEELTKTKKTRHSFNCIS